MDLERIMKHKKNNEISVEADLIIFELYQNIGSKSSDICIYDIL